MSHRYVFVLNLPNGVGDVNLRVIKNAIKRLIEKQEKSKRKSSGNPLHRIDEVPEENFSFKSRKTKKSARKGKKSARKGKKSAQKVKKSAQKVKKSARKMKR